VWGIDDMTHEIVGTTLNQQNMKIHGEEFDNWIRSMPSDNAEIDFHHLSIENKSVVLLSICKAVNRPVDFKKTTYIRVGSYTKKLREIPSKETMLWDKLRANLFEDEVAKTDARAEDVIGLLNTQTYFDRSSRPYPTKSTHVIQYLIEENMILKQDNGLYSITNLGALLFAKNLAAFDHLGRKTVRIISYLDDDKLSVNKEEQVESGYAVGFDGLLRLVNAMTPSEEVVSEGLREERSGYPPEAIRETIANALIHQDFTITGAGPMIEIFAHRIEVTNPGSLMVDSMRIIDAPPRSRNEALASLMRRMGICEERGTGWDRIALSCELKELPSAKIRGYESGTRVILYTGKSFSKISEEDRE
jgi:predicted HTH transcriptional regulator